MAFTALFALITFVVAWVALACAAYVVGNDLLHSFCNHYPDEARSQIPEAFSGMRHPRKVLYFMSSQSRQFLEEKQDSVLLSKRRSLLRILTAFLSLHFGTMLVFAVLFLALN